MEGRLVRVLAIGCHPDDIEISCAGTLAKYRKQGHDVIICHVANGNKGHLLIPPEELRDIRREEAVSSGKVIGAEVISLDMQDLEIYGDDRTSRDAVVDVIRYAKPDVILTHNPDDYMPDHVAVSKLVFDASFSATVPYYKTHQEAHAINAPIYYMDTLAGINFNPEEYVDISDVMELKLQMLNEHASQVKWLQEHDNIDLSEFVAAISRFRGLQCGVKYAEGFIPCRVWGKVRPGKLLP